MKETFDLGLGFLGAFALVFLVITFVYELHDPAGALPFSLMTVALVVADGGLWLVRRRLLKRTEDDS